jgi:hypothetical protein
MAAKGTLYNAYSAGLITEAQLRTLGTAAFDKIAQNLGAEVTNWSTDGFSASVVQNLSATDLLDEVTFALRRIAGTGVSVTYASFS